MYVMVIISLIKFRRIAGKPSFPNQSVKITKRYKRVGNYNHATSTLAINSHETSQDKLPEA